jgi:tetrahydromethanopterin S-methyltransferase subunit E
MAAFFSVLSWRSVINGQSKRSQGGCGVQFVFGVMLINILTITEWLVGVFET